ncbi:hypothetical protein [Lewinella sp. W8]|uniref:hypothetical protein n=1 Tax=Lewinella sp. W8 TaxID=2528208 RepID=UPI001068B57D|nr:hypothetical protein [Lewinella sp. W8]MTB51226.1 hypothetical protein [Lewinella sp. W8]
MKKSNTKKEVELSPEDSERRELFQKADEEASKERQLMIDLEGNVSSQREIIITGMQTTENPEEKYRIYYLGIQKLLKEHLPKGKKYEQYREYIYDEKNIFLNRGKAKGPDGVRGGDGRMTYQPDMQRILDETVKWIMSKGTMIDLYERYWDLNESFDYPHQSNLLGK